MALTAPSVQNSCVPLVLRLAKRQSRAASGEGEQKQKLLIKIISQRTQRRQRARRSFLNTNITNYHECYYVTQIYAEIAERVVLTSSKSKQKSHPKFIQKYESRRNRRTDGAARGEPCLHVLCRVVTEEDNKSKRRKFKR